MSANDLNITDNGILKTLLSDHCLLLHILKKKKN